MRYQSLEINYHTAPNNKSTALPILQKLISIMVCLLGRAEYVISYPLFGLKFIHVNKRGPRFSSSAKNNNDDSDENDKSNSQRCVYW